MENYQSTIETLNDLIELNNDRIEGYKKAIKEITNNDVDLKNFFINQIAESNRFKIELGTEVEVLGKEIENHTTVRGKIHRMWMEMKNAFSESNNTNILEECEFGEDAIKKAYHEALADNDLPAYIHEIVSLQLEVLLAAYDEVKSLREGIQ